MLARASIGSAVVLLSAALGLSASVPLAASGPTPEEQVAAALAGTPEERQALIEALRRRGPASVESALRALDAERLQDRGSPESRLLDRICGQRDCATSRLFWFTDLQQALAEAGRLDRPILSLRLLGRLDEDLSCANSRFFRTALYPDPAIAVLLRDHFVLHWHTVRPVPRLTIDFGDGRGLEGTVAGNSVHYVLDRQGRLVDALPGLYDPAAFAAELTDSARRAARAGKLSDEEFPPWARLHHEEVVRTLDARLQEELLAIGRGPDFFPLQPALNSFASAKPGSVAPTAREAAVLATSKAIVELPTLGHLDGLRGLLDEPPGEEIWKALAASPGHEVVLSHESEALLRKILQPSSEAEAQDVLRTFRSSVALDTARNQYLLRRSIHSLLAAREPGLTPEAVDEQVYGEVFRTPLSDPWFGLAPSEVFSAFRKVQGLPVAQAGQGIP